MSALTKAILNAGGIVAPILWAATIIYCGSHHPEYSHYRQFISELGERGSSTESLMRFGAFVLPGLMVAGFGLLLLTVFTHSKVVIGAAILVVLSGIGRFGDGVFPCDHGCLPVDPSFSQRMHNFSAVLNAFSLVAAGFLFFIAAPKVLPSRWFRWYSLISAVFGLLFLLMLRAAIPSGGGIGLFQRLSMGVLNVWLLVLSVMVWRLRTVPADNQAL